MSLHKRGMTLLELLIVIIIVGVLVVTYTTNYTGTAHVMQRGKAQNAITLIVQGEKMVRSETGAWPASTTPAQLGLLTGIDYTAVTNDADWAYVIDPATTTITATRSGGTHAAATVTYNFATDTWGGTHP